MAAMPAGWRRGAFRVAAVGVGSVVAGPLGAALGGAFGGLFGDQVEKLFEEYSRAGGEKLSEFGIHYCYDQLRDMQEHPPLEAVLRQALLHSLEDLRQGLDLNQKET